MTRALLLTFTLSLAACSDADFSVFDGQEVSADDSGSGFESDAMTSLRLDVYPSSSLAEGSLLNQTFLLDYAAPGVEVSLTRPVTLRGNLTGYDANPTADVAVPGQSTSVTGYVQAFVPGTVMSRKTPTDETGYFAAQVVPSDGYTLAWIPEVPAELPFVVVTDELVDGPDDLSLYLDYGLPVYGAVTHGDDLDPVAGVSVQAFDVASGVGGPVVTTDSYGEYMLRLYPGEYELRVSDEDDRVPTQSIPITVFDGDGLAQDVHYGTLERNAFRGTVVDADGEPVENVVVRLTSVDLDGTPDGTLVLELDTPRNGIFSDDIVPGVYEVEYIPPYLEAASGPTVGPVKLAEAVELRGPNNQLPRVTLPERVTVQARVTDPDGNPVPGALVRARELGFDHYVFEAIANAEGDVSIRVTDTELLWTLEPPAGVPGAVTFREADPFEVIEAGTLQLSEGRQVSGQVLWGEQPAAYAAVEVRDFYDRLYASALTDDEGRFSVQVEWPE
ncbi:MAG: hypothetical protein H6739_04305 [Alphaproteobacteria bacterium]|nr:hypothetical protein [Alphaproteobacteria bacterium]